MLNLDQFLLTKLSEECAEVSQRASKQMQFGRDQSQARDYVFMGQKDKVITADMVLTNAERTLQEMTDWMAIARLLEEAEVIPEISQADLSEAIEKKRAKLKKYAEYSISLGEVSPEVIEFFERDPGAVS